MVIGRSNIVGKPVSLLLQHIEGVACIVTPRRRGVGPTTLTPLLRNTPQAHETRMGV